MDLMTAMQVSAAGLSTQRTRMNVVSSNLANINTTRTPEGGPYRRKQVVVTASPVRNRFGQMLADRIREPKVLAITEDQSEFPRVFDPTHPDADEQGYVLLPNVNLMKEMVDMLSATRAYEANTAVISSIKNMARRAIEIGSAR
jgi:flagellar basal-body rod protein FlgC